VLDDPFDEDWFNNRPEEMLAFHEHLLAPVHSPPLATPRGPLAEALSDIFQRASCFAHSDWLKCFALHHVEYFLPCAGKLPIVPVNTCLMDKLISTIARMRFSCLRLDRTGRACGDPSQHLRKPAATSNFTSRRQYYWLDQWRIFRKKRSRLRLRK
jgi:hypothetical protein